MIQPSHLVLDDLLDFWQDGHLARVEMTCVVDELDLIGVAYSHEPPVIGPRLPDKSLHQG